MKSLHTALAVLLSAGLSLGVANAQQEPTAPATPATPAHEAQHPMDPDHQLKHLTKLLSLTDDQQAKIKPILAERDQKLTDLRNDTTTARHEKRGKMMAIMQDSDAKLTATLTPDQQKKYEDFKQERMEKMKEHHGQGKPAPASAPAPSGF